MNKASYIKKFLKYLSPKTPKFWKKWGHLMSLRHLALCLTPSYATAQGKPASLPCAAMPFYLCLGSTGS